MYANGSNLAAKSKIQYLKILLCEGINLVNFI